jgi:hypothetical protein
MPGVTKLATDLPSLVTSHDTPGGSEFIEIVCFGGSIMVAQPDNATNKEVKDNLFKIFTFMPQMSISRGILLAYQSLFRHFFTVSVS